MKYTLYTFKSSNTLSLCWLILLLVLGVQLLVGAHATQHAFHDADESCILYSTSEHSPSAAGAYLPEIKPYYSPNGLSEDRSTENIQAFLLTPYLSRAPPAFL